MDKKYFYLLALVLISLFIYDNVVKKALKIGG